ncbi:HAD family phosphatase [Falsarthrobacter nasiphocae]|uniref:HAD superfamily hydrolase (TIGR01509 family) n=1 Tax=Falsarthrobacter nasiphocae TaxID=189863 RepID=A0AAE4C5I7_9MICC|nr:HAD family phosphatase [Falsarthrobacter nasiphocae]MDR6891112.1 HAD superfamily hydrolase (TIGR01509 family) [Falsarthrobacter nasiphocae]
MSASPDAAPTTRLPAAILWDMDGTIIDSEPYWMTAERELVERFGLTWTSEDAIQLVGQALPTSAAILQRHGIDLSVREIIDTLTRRVVEQCAAGVPWRPGARELLAEARELGIPCALVTMSEGPFAEVVLAQMPAGAFQAVVTGDRVAQGKPAPDAYELGFLELSETAPGLAKDECVAIEDSWPGYCSATSAGLTTVAVPLHAALPEGEVRIEWDGLEGRTCADLGRALTP